MRILHFSDEGLPDLRIGRYSYIQAKNNLELIFCGDLQKDSWYTEYFTKVFYLPISPSIKLGFPFYYARYKKKFAKIYKEVEPDVVHAHNLVTAKVCLDLKIPVVFDDHEFWSYQVAARGKEINRKITKRIIIDPYYLYKTKKWEKQILNDANAIIAVSPPQAENHRNYNSNVFEVMNYPTSYEIAQFPPLNQQTDNLKSVLITKYNSFSEKTSVEKLTQAVNNSNHNLAVIGKFGHKLPNIKYLGFIPHMDLLSKLTTFHLGLVLFPESKRSIGYFKYVCPNRIFVYAHAGVTPVIHKEMTFLRNLFGNLAPIISGEEQITNILTEYSENDSFLQQSPKKLQDFSRKNLIFDQFHDNIMSAYKNAQN